MKLSKILNKVNYKGTYKDIDISNIYQDSRKISKKNSLFLAIKGAQYNGNQYIKEAIDLGVKAIITDIDIFETFNIPILKVDNCRKAIPVIARNFFKNPSKKIHITGITGTNGKTSIAYIISKILEFKNLNWSSLGTLGLKTSKESISTDFTTPESVDLNKILYQLVKLNTSNLIMEVSSHALSQNRVDCIDFNIAVFSNLSHDHIDFHGNLENYFNSKLVLFKKLNSNNLAIINENDCRSEEIKKNTKAQVLTYGFSNKCNIYPENFESTLHGTKILLNINKDLIEITTPLFGSYNIENIMASFLVALNLNINKKNIAQSLSKDLKIPGRLEKVPNQLNKNVFIDYAHSPDAYENIFRTLNNILNKDINLITIFGCGGNRDKSKRPEMARIVEKYSKTVIITNDNPRNEDPSLIINDIKKGFKSLNNIKIITNREEAILYGMSITSLNSVLLILGKGREDYQEVSGIKKPHSDFNIIRNYNES